MTNHTPHCEAEKKGQCSLYLRLAHTDTDTCLHTQLLVTTAIVLLAATTTVGVVELDDGLAVLNDAAVVLHAEVSPLPSATT